MKERLGRFEDFNPVKEEIKYIRALQGFRESEKPLVPKEEYDKLREFWKKYRHLHPESEDVL